MSDRPALKIYGERNTGTNYVEALSRKNLVADILPGQVERSYIPAEITRQLTRVFPTVTYRLHEIARDRYFEKTFRDNLGWKHMNPSIERIGARSLETVRFLMLVKNPYAWVLSLFQKPYHVGRRYPDLSRFLEAELPVFLRRENVGPLPLVPVEVWNRKMKGYLKLRESSRFSTIVRYEDFLQDERATLSRIGRNLDICTADRFESVGNKAQNAEWGETRDNYADYYLRQKWLSKLTGPDIRRINALLDGGIARELGYDLLDPDEAGPAPGGGAA